MNNATNNAMNSDRFSNDDIRRAIKQIQDIYRMYENTRITDIPYLQQLGWDVVWLTSVFMGDEQRHLIANHAQQKEIYIKSTVTYKVYTPITKQKAEQ